MRATLFFHSLESGGRGPEVGVAEVDVGTSAVPVSRKGLRVEARVDAVLFCYAVKDVPVEG